MTSGYYRMHRGWMDHPMFKPEPYTDREAFMWLIENAAWKDGRKRVGAITVEVKRGQVAASLRFMACAWKWQEPKVRRFLSRMKIDAAIDAASDAGVNVITICNYDKFQTDAHATDAPIDAPIDAASTQTRIKKEEVSKEEEGSEAKASGADAPSGGGPVLAVVDGEPTLEKVYWDAVTAAQATLPKGLPQSTFRAYRGLARRWLELHDGDVEAAIAEIENSATKANAFTWLKTCIDDRKAGAKIPQWKQKPPKGHTGMWNGTRYIRGCPMSSAAI